MPFGSELVGRAAVELSLEAGKFLTDFGRIRAETERGAGSIEARINASIKTMTAVGAASLAISLKASKAAQDWGGHTRRLQRELGLTVQEASRLAYAADRMGVEVDALSAGFGMLFKHVAANDAVAQKYALTLKKANGETKTSQELIEEVADIIAKMPPGVQRTAAALELLGRGGKTLLPILQQGSKELRDLSDQAKKFGLEITPKNVQQLKELKDKQRDLTAAIKGWEVQLGLKVIPLQTVFYEQLVKIAGILDHIPDSLILAGVGLGTLAKPLGAVASLAANTSTALSGLGVGRRGGESTRAGSAGRVVFDSSSGQFRNLATGQFVPVATGIATGTGIRAALGRLGLSGSRGVARFGGLGGVGAGLLGGGLIIIENHYRSQQKEFHSTLGRPMTAAERARDLIAGAGAALKDPRDVHNTPEVIERMRKSYLALRGELGPVFDEMRAKVGAFLQTVNEGFESSQAKLSGLFATAFGDMTIDQVNEWRTKMIRNFSGVETAMGRLGGKSKVTAKEIVAAFTGQRADLQKFRGDFDVVRRRLGVGGSEFTKSLAEKGLEAAPIVAALTRASDAQIKAIVNAIQGSKGLSQQIVQGILGTPGLATFANRGTSADPLYVVVTNPAKRVEAGPLSPHGNVSPRSRDNRHRRGGTAHTGGFIGPFGVVMHSGGEVPITAQPGEFMQPVAAVQRYGLDFMESVRTGRFNPNQGSRGNTTIILAPDMRGAFIASDEDKNEFARSMIRPLTNAIREAQADNTSRLTGDAAY